MFLMTSRGRDAKYLPDATNGIGPKEPEKLILPNSLSGVRAQPTLCRGRLRRRGGNSSRPADQSAANSPRSCTMLRGTRLAASRAWTAGDGARQPIERGRRRWNLPIKPIRQAPARERDLLGWSRNAPHGYSAWVHSCAGEHFTSPVFSGLDRIYSGSTRCAPQHPRSPPGPSARVCGSRRGRT